RTIQDFGSEEVNNEKNRSTLDGISVQLFTDLAFAGGEGGVTWGAEYYTDTVDSSRSVTDLGNGTVTRVRGRFPDGSTMDSAAVYASLAWRKDDVSLHGGLRYSRFDISLPAEGESPAADLSPDDLTGDLRLEWTLTDRLNFVANVGRGFRPPNIFDLGTLGPRPGNRFNIPNPKLGPETLWGYDFGFKTRGDTWQAEIYFFYSDYDDKIGSRDTGELTESGRIIVQSDNINSAELYGIESGIRGYLRDGLEVYGVLNVMRGEETEADGSTVPGDRIPPLNGRAGLVWNLRDDLRLEPFLLFAGDQDRLSPRDMSDPRINPMGTPGWGTLNLLAAWQATEQLEIGLRLENLGDSGYREHGSGIDAPGLNVGLWMSFQL
ncbi:MAG: TonB-dependent receptor, partial [Xanthomonadales bacterium]|nr:TonB-dependent receptor [Xanthomonadales bacterium]